MKVLPNIGKKCETCGEIVRAVEIECRGARDRREPMPQQEVCRCIHPGDLMCNCGNPCYSFF